MAVTTNSQGDNSTQLIYPASETLANIMTAIDAFITAHGWTLHDASAGTNAKAYKALCLDGLAYKYVVVDLNSAGYLLLKLYDSWNAGSHSGTDLAYNSDVVANAQRIDLTNGGVLYIFATARYMVMLSLTVTLGSSTGNSWCGCLEVTRDNPEDINALGYMPAIWANGNLMAGSATYCVSFCKTRQGATAGSAANQTFVATEMFAGGMLPGGVGYMLQANTPTASQVNQWNYKNWAWDLRVGCCHATTGFEKRGRITGLHYLTKGIASPAPCADDVSLKLNADGFLDPAGTPTSCWILSEATNGCRWAIIK